MDGFFADVDLSEGIWAPGRNNGFIGSEVLWLQNIVTGETVGIMQNRRYNFYFGSIGDEFYFDEQGNETENVTSCGSFNLDLAPQWLESHNQWDEYGDVMASTSQFLDIQTEHNILVYDPLNGGPGQPVYIGPTTCTDCPFGVVFILDETSPFLLFKSTPSSGRMANPESQESELFEEHSYLDNSKIKIYPNPAQSEVVIKIGPIANEGIAEIYDPTGRKVGQFRLNQSGRTLLNISEYEAGSYLVRIRTTSKEEWKRLEIL